MTRKKKNPENKIEQHKQGTQVSEGSPKTPSESPRISLVNFERHQMLFLALLILVGFIIYSNTLHSPFVLDDKDAITGNRFIRMAEISDKDYNRCRRGVWEKSPGGNAQLWSQLLFWPIQRPGISPGKYLYSYHKRHFALFLSEINADAIQSANNLTPQIRFGHSNHFILFYGSSVARKPGTNPVRHLYCATNDQHGGHVLSSGTNPVCQRPNCAADCPSRKVMPGQNIIISGLPVCFVAGILALGSKESTVLLPVFMFLYEWYFFQDLDLKLV